MKLRVFFEFHLEAVPPSIDNYLSPCKKETRRGANNEKECEALYRVTLEARFWLESLLL
jgi:hypothetical protein